MDRRVRNLQQLLAEVGAIEKALQCLGGVFQSFDDVLLPNDAPVLYPAFRPYSLKSLGTTSNGEFCFRTTISKVLVAAQEMPRRFASPLTVFKRHDPRFHGPTIAARLLQQPCSTCRQVLHNGRRAKR